MTTRLLPPEEWAKLGATHLEAVWPVLRAGVDRVVVVEDAGEIVGCWTLIPVVHCEGIWIRPDQRRQGRVARRLLRAMKTEARAMGARAVMTTAFAFDIADLATRVGAEPVPGSHFVLPVQEGVCPSA